VETSLAARPRTVDSAIPGAASSALNTLAELTSTIVPVLYEVGEKTWPRLCEYRRKRWGVIGPEITVHEILPRRFTVMLRRYDLATMWPSWRLEAAGPVEFFEWDDSGRILGSYGVRYSVLSVAPVVDEQSDVAGVTINSRSATGVGGMVNAIDARIDSAAFVRAISGPDIASALRAVAGKPRVEEFRPGISPTSEYFEVVSRQNKSAYFEARGANEYLGPEWTPVSIRNAFRNPAIRAVVLGNPSEPTLVPEPAGH
jgi:hypothetical protein